MQLRCRLWWHNLHLCCYLLDQVPTTLLAFVTQLASALLSPCLKSNYFIDSCNTTCNYVVHSCDTICKYVVSFSIKFQLSCWLLSHNLQLRCYVLDQVPTTLLILLYNLQLRCRLLWHNLQLRSLLSSEENWAFYMSMWATTVGNSREQYIAAGKNFFHILVFLMQHGLQSTQSRDLLLYAKSWQWRCVNRSANSQQNTIEALKRIFWRKNVIFRLHKNPSMIMSCYCGKTQKSPSFGIHFLEDCHERNAFRHSAKLILKKIRAGFPVRRADIVRSKVTQWKGKFKGTSQWHWWEVLLGSTHNVLMLFLLVGFRRLGIHFWRLCQRAAKYSSNVGSSFFSSKKVPSEHWSAELFGSCEFAVVFTWKRWNCWAVQMHSKLSDRCLMFYIVLQTFT